MPLAAAVSGKATRTLGVWQGSAAQQAQEMAPEGVRVVSAFHTVSAALLTDLDHELDEDVLICGDRREDKARLAELVDLIPGLRRGRLRPARDGPDRRAADAADHLDQRAPQGRAPGSRSPACPRLSADPSSSSPAAPAARSWPAECSTSSAPSELVVIANTGDDIEIYGAYVSPDPDLVTFWLADRIDERGWGLAGDTFHVMDGLRELGVEVWFNLGDRDLAIGIERARALRGGRPADRGARARSPRRSACRAAVLPMSDRPVRTAGAWRTGAGGRSRSS